MENSNMEVIRASVSTIAVGLAILAVEIIRIDEATHRRRRRVIWMKDILRKRNEKGTFNLLISQLLTDDYQYKNFLRKSKDSFAFLLSCVET